MDKHGMVTFSMIRYKTHNMIRLRYGITVSHLTVRHIYTMVCSTVHDISIFRYAVRCNIIMLHTVWRYNYTTAYNSTWYNYDNIVVNAQDIRYWHGDKVEILEGKMSKFSKIFHNLRDSHYYFVLLCST